MKHRIRASLVVVFAAAALVLQACGAGPDGIPARRGTNPTSPPPFGPGAEEAEGELSACATSTATADAKPVHLVIMFDRSGSMEEGGRWTACTTATEAFLESEASRGMSASLHYFPPVGMADAVFLGCKPEPYAKPAVARTKLPSKAFRESFTTTRTAGGTPTKPALEGAVQYARIVAREGDAKVAIVLVTDGEPTDCASDVASVSSVAANVSASIPTYVVGIGDLASLDAIAASGGTKKALIVDTKDPAQIERDLVAAIGKIKSQVLACDYSIPTPPKGETFERGKVNVIHRPESGEEKMLRYSPSCAKGEGWRYDDENAPTRIIVCEASCKTLEATPGSVEVLFGCATKSTDVK